MESPRFDLRAEGRGPIELTTRAGEPRWSPVAVSRLTWAFLALGTIIRLVRFAVAHPPWGDECYVAANLIERDYAGLLRPLDYDQVAPVLFLWVELTAVRVLGFSEWSLRVYPTACAIAGLFVFRHLAGRVMAGPPLVMAVAIVAVAVNPIRHGGEAKPYAADFLASTVLLAMAVEWWRRPDRSRWLWGMAATAPIAMGTSIPAAFVLGGIGLAIAGPVFRERKAGVTAAYLALNGAIAVGVLASWKLYGGAQSATLKAYMDYYWSANFPPLRDPGRLVLWLIKAHTGDLFAYPVGGSNCASLATVACVVAGSVGLWRRGRSTIVAACLAPLVGALAASTIRAYPYGETERLMQFEGPMICLLAGSGLAWFAGRARRRPDSPRRVAVAFLVLFAAIGAGSIVADVVRPAKSIYDLRAREFARRFWPDVGRDAEVACCRVDLGLDFEGPDDHGRSADYLTYQKIYSDRHRRGAPLDWASVSATRPLRCVLYDGVPDDSPLFASWRGQMARHYRLTRAETLRVNEGVAPKGVSFEDRLTVLEFVPRGEPVDPAKLAQAVMSSVDRGDGLISGGQDDLLRR